MYIYIYIYMYIYIYIYIYIYLYIYIGWNGVYPALSEISDTQLNTKSRYLRHTVVNRCPTFSIQS